MEMLSDSEFETFQRQGYLVKHDIVDLEFIARLKNRLREYTHGGREPVDPILCETSPKVERGEIEVDNPGDGYGFVRGLAEGDELFRDLVFVDDILNVIEDLHGPDLKLLRAVMLMNPPKINSFEGVHQDSPYFPIQPMDSCAVLVPFDKLTPENGCLNVIPEGHLRGALPMKDDGVRVSEECYDLAELEPIPLSPGSVVFYHSLIPHAHSLPDMVSDQWGRAMKMTYLSSRSRYTGEGEVPHQIHVKGQTFPGCVQ